MSDGVKYHKSCTYCRYRKIKCVKIEGTALCQHCQSCGVECVYSVKEKSQKRRAKSAKIAASVVEQKQHSTTTTTTTTNRYPSTGLSSFLSEPAYQYSPPSIPNASPAASMNGISPPPNSHQNRQSSISDDSNGYPRAVGSPEEVFTASMTNPSANPVTTKRSVKDIYTQFVQPFTPFLPDELAFTEATISKLCKCCISLSALTSADYMSPDATTELLLDVCNSLLQQETEWSSETVASVFLLASRSKLPEGVLERCLEAYNEKSFPLTGRMDSKIILGAIVVDAWNALLDERAPVVDPSILTNFDLYLREVDDNTFGYYFLLLTQILLRLLFSFQENDATSPGTGDYYSYCQQKYRRIQLESELLIWPVKLPKHLTVVKDEMIAPNEAVILHVMHNTVMLALYDHALKNPETYGRQMAVFPVPGLLQFMTGMAKSTFKCGGHMWHRWPLLRQCQVLTANYMLDLHQSTEYEFCKRALAWWLDNETNPPLYQQVKEFLGDADWTEHSDGAVVFWVYRDVRSMSLDLLLTDARDRGDL